MAGGQSGALTADISDVEELVALLFPPAPPPEAQWGDFTGLGVNADITCSLLKKALAQGTDEPVGPALLNEVLSAGRVARKPRLELPGRHGAI